MLESRVSEIRLSEAGSKMAISGVFVFLFLESGVNFCTCACADLLLVGNLRCARRESATFLAASGEGGGEKESDGINTLFGCCFTRPFLPSRLFLVGHKKDKRKRTEAENSSSAFWIGNSLFGFGFLFWPFGHRDCIIDIFGSKNQGRAVVYRKRVYLCV